MKVSEWYARNLEEISDAELTRYVGDPEDPPLVGHTYGWHYSDWDIDHQYTPDDGIVFLSVPCTYWDDNNGSLIDRSNREALWEDFPNTFVKLERGIGGELLLPWDGDIDDTVAAAIHRLLDYGIYDDDHHYQLRDDMVMQYWESSQYEGDYVYTINKLIHEDEPDVRDTFKVDDKWLNDQFWTYVRNLGNDDWIEEMNADTVYVSQDAIEDCAKEVIDTLIADWNAKVTWLHERTEGLF